MITDADRRNIYRQETDNIEVLSWDYDKISEDLPLFFRMSRSSHNGAKTFIVRKAPGYKPAKGAGRWMDASGYADKLSNKYHKLIADGQLPRITIFTNAATLTLTSDAVDFVLLNGQLVHLIANGWRVEVL